LQFLQLWHMPLSETAQLTVPDFVALASLADHTVAQLREDEGG